ncbi:hypothetical protein [Thalassotalea agariperforans]
MQTISNIGSLIQFFNKNGYVEKLALSLSRRNTLVDGAVFNNVEQAFIKLTSALTSNVHKTLSHEDYLAKLFNHS